MLRASSAPEFWHWNRGAISPFHGGVPISDRGFRYGQHLFESIAFCKGRALFADEHLQRLDAASRRVGIPASGPLLSALRRFLFSISLPDGMLRIYLTAGVGAPASPVKCPSCFLSWEDCKFPTSESISQGMVLKLHPKPFLGEGWGEKSGNYLPHLAVLESARSAGADEAIVTNVKGRVLSCAMGNLLVWMPSSRRAGSVLCTPAPEREPGFGPRAGVVLGWVRTQGVVNDRILRVPDLLRASAMAVTNSRLGVMPVSELDGKKFPKPSLALELAQAYLQQHVLFGGA